MKVYELLSKVVTQTTWVNYYRELDGVHSLRLSGDLSTAWPSNTETHWESMVWAEASSEAVKLLTVGCARHSRRRLA